MTTFLCAVVLPSPYSLREMSTKIISGGKGGRCLRLTSLQASCLDFLKIWELQPPGNFWVSPCLYRDFFYPLLVLCLESESVQRFPIGGGGDFDLVRGVQTGCGFPHATTQWFVPLRLSWQLYMCMSLAWWSHATDGSACHVYLFWVWLY